VGAIVSGRGITPAALRRSWAAARMEEWAAAWRGGLAACCAASRPAGDATCWAAGRWHSGTPHRTWRLAAWGTDEATRGVGRRSLRGLEASVVGGTLEA
jgi:hypothetical protein